MSRKSRRPPSSGRPAGVTLNEVEGIFRSAREYAQGYEDLATALGRWQNGFKRHPGPYVAGDGGYLASRVVGTDMMYISGPLIELAAKGFPVLRDYSLMMLAGRYASGTIQSSPDKLLRDLFETPSRRVTPEVEALQDKVITVAERIRSAIDPMHTQLSAAAVERALVATSDGAVVQLRPAALRGRSLFVTMATDVDLHADGDAIDSPGRMVLQTAADFARGSWFRESKAAGLPKEVVNEAREPAKMSIAGILIPGSSSIRPVDQVRIVSGVRFGDGPIRFMGFEELPVDSSSIGRRLASLIQPALEQRVQFRPGKPSGLLSVQERGHATTESYTAALQAAATTKYGSVERLYELYSEGAFQTTIESPTVHHDQL